MKLFIIALSLIALFPNLAAAGQPTPDCVAILLPPGVEQADCRSADEILMNMNLEQWNHSVCAARTIWFEQDGVEFNRDRESGNLISGACEWEVRAPSGKN